MSANVVVLAVKSSPAAPRFHATPPVSRNAREGAMAQRAIVCEGATTQRSIAREGAMAQRAIVCEGATTQQSIACEGAMAQGAIVCEGATAQRYIGHERVTA